MVSPRAALIRSDPLAQSLGADPRLRPPGSPPLASPLARQSNALRPYLSAVRSTLTAALTLENFGSQVRRSEAMAHKPAPGRLELTRMSSASDRSSSGTTCPRLKLGPSSPPSLARPKALYSSS